MLFCFYSLGIVWDEQYAVTYTLAENQPAMRYLSCVPLRQVYAGQKSIDLDRMRSDLYDQLANLYLGRRSVDSTEYIWNATKSRNYFIMLDSVCFVCNDSDKLQKTYRFFNYVNVSLFAIDMLSFNLVKLSKTGDLVTQLIVINEDHPFSECRDRAYSRFHCLNACFKAKNRLSKYFYAGDEAGGTIFLDYQDNQPNGTSIAMQENRCFGQCKPDHCRLSYFVSSREDNYVNRYGRKGLNLQANTFKARRVIERSNFLLQQVGLVCLLAGCSVHQLSLKLLRVVSAKIGRRIKMRPIRFVSLKAATLLVCLFVSAYLYTCLILDYQARQSSPIRKEITMRLMEPETIHLVVCVDFSAIVPGKDQSYFHGLTLSNLEAQTNLENGELVEAISLDYQNKQTPVHWRIVKSSTIFRFKARCFQLEIYPAISEPRYQMVLAISKLTVRLKKMASLFLLAENEQYSSESYYLQPSYEFYKIETSLSKRRNECVDYEKLYEAIYEGVWPSCNSRVSCIERCVNRLSIQRYGHLTARFLHWTAHKHHFNRSEWNTLKIRPGSIMVSENLTKGCEQQIVNNRSCNEVRFERSGESDYLSPNGFHVELYYQFVRLVEVEAAGYLLLLDILNIQTIFHGLNLYRFLLMIYSFVQTKLNWLTGRPFWIYLICSTCFAYHTFQLLFKSLNDDLVWYQHFEIVESKRMPTAVFCYTINYPSSLIDKHRPLTGGRLQELTANLRPDTVFANVTYLNERSEWITLDNQSNFADANFKIETFFFIRRKCFGLQLNLTYPNDQFYFSLDHTVLRVYFNRSFVLHDQRACYFMTKVSDSHFFFSPVLILRFNGFRQIELFSIVHSSLFLHYQDKFNTIRNLIRRPLSLLHGQNDLHDVQSYLRGLLKNFRLAFSNRVTLNLPITEKLFDYEIDDDAFERYFAEVQNVTDHSAPASANYEREFVVNSMTKSYPSLSAPHIPLDGFYFAFDLDFLVKVINVTNEQSFSSLILSLLNVLSLWFGLGVLDLYVGIHQLGLLVRRLFLCKRFFRLKCRSWSWSKT